MEDLALLFIAALLLALVHLLAGYLRFSQVGPRSAWLSFAGGVGAAFIFVHLLPELAAAQALFEESGARAMRFPERHVYLVALTGLVVYYAIERAVKIHRRRVPAEQAPAVGAVFWLHMASFAIYNGVIGHLLTERGGRPQNLAWFTLALGLHLVVMDDGLRRDHPGLYHRYGRWLLSAAILAGWMIGQLTALPDRALAVMLAFLAGALVLNVIKEELPAERESRLWPFVAGAVLYAAVLIVV